jgi:ketosteroid isomerase-like protein
MDRNREIVEQFMHALTASDWETQDRLVTDDFVEEYPQSGEVIRGSRNRRAIVENYPGGTPQEAGTKSAPAPRPQFFGGGEQFTVLDRITYPNGETWQYIGLVEFRGGKIAKVRSYFAAPFEAPAWRAPYVEREPAEVGSR